LIRHRQNFRRLYSEEEKRAAAIDHDRAFGRGRPPESAQHANHERKLHLNCKPRPREAFNSLCNGKLCNKVPKTLEKSFRVLGLQAAASHACQRRRLQRLLILLDKRLDSHR
jgi:hypothetical protein